MLYTHTLLSPRTAQTTLTEDPSPAPSFTFFSFLFLFLFLLLSGINMAIWLFENRDFNDAWIPFDRANQKKLEFIYRHHDALLKHFATTAGSTKCINIISKQEIDEEEEDGTAFHQIQYTDNCISITLHDSHFQEPIVLYPHMLLGCLSDRDILVARAELTTAEINDG